MEYFEPGNTPNEPVVVPCGISLLGQKLLPDASSVPVADPFSDGAGTIGEMAEIVWDKSVSKADQTDYAIAVCCGVVAGLIDSFYVGEFSLERANQWGDEKVSRFVKWIADQVCTTPILPIRINSNFPGSLTQIARLR